MHKSKGRSRSVYDMPSNTIVTFLVPRVT